jgi:hypothetical protein
MTGDLPQQTKEPRAIPPGPGDGECDFGEAVVGPSIPGKAIGQDHHPLRLPIPLADQHRARGQFGSLHIQCHQPGGRCCATFLDASSIENLSCHMIEITEAIRLQAKRNDGNQ